jgi:hypothetical protein
MRDYLQSRAAALDAAGIRARVQAAAREFEAALEGLSATEAAWRPQAGEWNIREVVDHLAQTTARVAEELRHLIAGRRPPGPPVYEALTSGAPAWEEWSELIAGLRAANEEFDRVLAEDVPALPASCATVVTARTILVVYPREPDGSTKPDIFAAELSWKEYALLQRVHLLDHRNQVVKLRAGARSHASAPERG